MADEQTSEEATSGRADHQPPAGAQSAGTWTGAGGSIEYVASANWTVLRKNEKPAAEVFSVSYVGHVETDRPVMFIFNGGPGASSAYLHMGAVGPTRVAFLADGGLPQMPPQLVANAESWLAFADLVFVDPVGTGFSRVIEGDGAAAPGNDKPGEADDPKEYFGYKRDLEALCEFMGRWLSAHDRWGSSVFIAGESYGGYRVGRLARMLQETAGIGLTGAVLISPALELGSLAANDYDVLGWLDLLPTMAAAAVHHGRSRAFGSDVPADDVRREAERFATGKFVSLLTRGASMPAGERERTLGRLADLIGLPADLVARAEGRITIVIAHGRYDLVTPYHASDRLRNLMRLDPQMAGRMTVRHFGGGHMFYAWEESRRAFTEAIAAFVA